jgi:hypothetical protein
MTKALRRNVATTVFLAGFLGVGTAAYADQTGESGSARYKFTIVLDSQRDGLVAIGCAAINTVGTVAVRARNSALDVETYITKRGANDAPVIVAHTLPVADFPTFCDNGFPSFFSDPSINEKGEIAFQANPRRLNLTTRPDCATPEQRQRRQGAFLGRGGALTTIAHSINPPGGDFISEFLVADLSVNTFGKVALVPELDVTFDSGLFVGSKEGKFEQRFIADEPTNGFTFDGISSRVSLNELGQIAFDTSLSGTSTSGIFLSHPNGSFKTIVDNTGPFDSVRDPSLNFFGRVAFLADRFDEMGQQIFSVNTSRGGPVTTIALSNPDPMAQGPVYDSFREPSLNDFGRVAFTADLRVDPAVFVTTQGVFTGPDPVADKVLQAGDLIEGVPVTSIVSCSESLNNLGQIVMTVQSENPDTGDIRTFVVKATPKELPNSD